MLTKTKTKQQTTISLKWYTCSVCTTYVSTVESAIVPLKYKWFWRGDRR